MYTLEEEEPHNQGKFKFVNGQGSEDIEVSTVHKDFVKYKHYILAKELAIKNKFDIFTISESWLENTVTDIEVENPGCNIFTLDQSTKAGGGVCAFVSDRFKIA